MIPIIDVVCKLFLAILGDLQQKKQISGIVTGDQIKTSMFLPHIYVKNQTQWIHDFYKQNGYLGMHFTNVFYLFIFFFFEYKSIY